MIGPQGLTSSLSRGRPQCRVKRGALSLAHRQGCIRDCPHPRSRSTSSEGVAAEARLAAGPRPPQEDARAYGGAAGRGLAQEDVLWERWVPSAGPRGVSRVGAGWGKAQEVPHCAQDTGVGEEGGLRLTSGTVRSWGGDGARGGHRGQG